MSDNTPTGRAIASIADQVESLEKEIQSRVSLSFRDQCAIACMDIFKKDFYKDDDNGSDQTWAAICFEFADVMEAERQKRSKK